MFRKISYTWRIMGASWQVLNQDKELMLFPLISALALIVVTASFVAPIALSGMIGFSDQAAAHPGGAHAPQALYYVVLFLFYFCNYFVITFFNTAIVASAIKRLSGGEPTFGYALSEAVSRLPQIFGWALVAATVGMVLRLIEERSKWLGRLVAGLLGAAWTITTFLVVPVLVAERKGPIDAFKRSASLLKSTWGEQLVGGFSFGAIFFLLMLPAFVLIGGSVFTMEPSLIGAAVGIAVLYIIVLALIQATLQTIFQAVVYVYATVKVLPPSFDREMMAGAMTPK